MPTGILWLDEAVASAGLPELADAEASLMIHNQISRGSLTMEGFRRLPILYRRVGRRRVYEVADVVADAKQKILNVKPRLPAARAPLKSPRASFTGVKPADVERAAPVPAPTPTQSPPITAHKRETVGQRQETETETAL
jgi:hypothetical protein